MNLSKDFLHTMNDLYQKFTAFDATQTNRLDRYRNIEPESAYYLAMLIRIQKSKNILEIGTSTGYSTLWLANAAQITQGHITTLEIDELRTAQAKHYAQMLALDQIIDFWVGDAKEFLETSTATFDFILLDAEREAYVDYWPSLIRKLNVNGVLIVDNVISHADQVKDFIDIISKDAHFMMTTLPIGAGLLMVTLNN